MVGSLVSANANVTTVLHIITALDRGGAEIVLASLLNTSDREKYFMTVATLRGGGVIEKQLVANGISVFNLELQSVFSMLLSFIRLIKLIRRLKPNVIQTWLYHADLLGGLAAYIAGKYPVIWGIHSASPEKARTMTRLVSRLCARLSKKIPSDIIVCSEYARQTHIKAGYSADMTVIENGVDILRFSKRIKDKNKNRKNFVVGHIGRWQPIKRHEFFIKSIAIVNQRYQDCRFVMVGRGIDNSNTELLYLIESLGLGDCVQLLGDRSDIPDQLNNMNILVSTSDDESFGLVVVEAMACEVSCIAMDIGIMADIIGEAGKVVTKSSVDDLANAIIGMIELPQDELELLGKNARSRIVERYSDKRMTEAYENVYNKYKKQ